MKIDGKLEEKKAKVEADKSVAEENSVQALFAEVPDVITDKLPLNFNEGGHGARKKSLEI